MASAPSLTELVSSIILKLMLYNILLKIYCIIFHSRSTETNIYAKVQLCKRAKVHSSLPIIYYYVKLKRKLIPSIERSVGKEKHH